MQLGQLRWVRMLCVQIYNEMTHEHLKVDADVLLSALSSCRRVVLQLPGNISWFESVLSDLAMAGVPALDIKLVEVEPVQPPDDW